MWSEQGETIGRKNLTQTLRRLRADLGDDSKDSRYFETTRKTIGLLESAEIVCDVAAFDEVMAGTVRFPFLSGAIEEARTLWARESLAWPSHAV